MLYSVNITNELGKSLLLTLTSPEESGLYVRSIDGLGPAKADINTTDISTNDGSTFNSARLTTRNIVLNLGYLMQQTIEDSRQRTYEFFPVKTKVRLEFVTDNRTLSIDGYVESNEPDIFSEESGGSISIICPNPYFTLPQDEVEMFSGSEDLFEFPFSNESMTENLIEMAQIVSDTYRTIEYLGDAPTGFTIFMHFTDVVINPQIYNLGTREIVSIDTTKLETMLGAGIVAGDDIIIQSIKGNKSIVLIRGGVEYNILNVLARNTPWFTLNRGDNIFAYTADVGVSNIEFRMEYPMLYVGV